MGSRLVILSLLVTAFVFASCSEELPGGGKLWAVLVSGSSGYENYRHQADVCHAYHVLREHGVPADNIITMMYDDIAYNNENPQPGVVINAVNGTNVYEGVFRDYIGQDVNSTNFLKVLVGDAEGLQGVGSGRVLQSGPSDHVFINFVDHGANGLICFPNDTDLLYAPDLMRALMQMSDKEMYGKMVVYVEACESGSMFDKFLSSHLNIFAVTAARRGEDSYACCWDDAVKAYLGDVFSVNWMDDSDAENLQEETLAEQYKVVVQETNTSHPQEFGHLSIGRLHVGQFLGMQKFPQPYHKVSSKCNDAVRGPDVPVAVLQRKLEAAKSHSEQEQLESEIRNLFKLRRSVDHVMNAVLEEVYGEDQKHVAHMLKGRNELQHEHFACYRKLVDYWLRHCYGQSTSPYGLRKLPVFANVCVEDADSSDQIIRAMGMVCPRMKVKKGIR